MVDAGHLTAAQAVKGRSDYEVELDGDLTAAQAVKGCAEVRAAAEGEPDRRTGG